MSTIPIQFTSLKTETSEQLRKFTSEKFVRLNKFAASITSIHITFIVDKLRHIAEANVHVPKTNIHARAESEDMYKTIDFLVDKLLTQLAKYKEKVTEHA
jgi:putative sigma-54 modulation protein